MVIRMAFIGMCRCIRAEEEEVAEEGGEEEEAEGLWKEVPASWRFLS